MKKPLITTPSLLLLVILCASFLLAGCSHHEARIAAAAMEQDFSRKGGSIMTTFASHADGSTDISSSLQKALDEVAAKGGGTVFLPVGRYRLDGSITIPAGVTLKGEWTAPHHAQLQRGTVLLAYAGRGAEDGTPLISLSPSSCLQGLTIYYPEQRLEDVQPYPWTIQGRGMHNNVLDVTLVNPYKGIDFGTHANELHHIRNVFGCPLKLGVYINRCTDIGRIENVHFNPHYWFRDQGEGVYTPDALGLIAWLRENAVAFHFERTDWEYVLNTFCFGYKIGYHFGGTGYEVCNGNFLGIGADGGDKAVVVDTAAAYGLLITNGEFVSMDTDDPVQIVVSKSNTGVVQFQNCAFWGPSNQIARVHGGSVSFVQCNFAFWDRKDAGLAGIEADGASLVIQNCVFQQPKQHIKLGPGTTGVVSGNLTKGKMSIDNQAGDQVQIGLNAVLK